MENNFKNGNFDPKNTIEEQILEHANFLLGEYSVDIVFRFVVIAACEEDIMHKNDFLTKLGAIRNGLEHIKSVYSNSLDQQSLDIGNDLVHEFRYNINPSYKKEIDDFPE